MNAKTLLIIAAFAAIYLLWGSTYLAVTIALHSMPPFLLMGTRSVVGGALLLTYARVTGATLGSLRDWAFASVCGFFFFVGCHGVLAYAQQHVASGLAAVLLATIPFWITGFSALVPVPHRLPARTMILLAPGLVGVGLIAWREVVTVGAAGPSISDVLMLLSASASWAIGTVLSNRKRSESSPLLFSGQELIAGGAVLLAICATTGEPTKFQFSQLSIDSLLAWSYLTVAGTVVGFLAYTWLLKQVPATLVATYTFVNPIIAVLLGWAFLGEQPTAWMIAGAILVLASVGGLLVEQRNEMDEPIMPKFAQALLPANPALSQFGPLIGPWIATITWSDSIQKVIGGPQTVQGSAMFEWAKDRYFVVHSTRGGEEHSPFAHWMIGHDDASGAFAAFYADSRGQSRIYEMSFAGNVWKMWRTASGTSQRFIGLVSPDQKNIEGRWESSKDGTNWEDEFTIIYARSE